MASLCTSVFMGETSMCSLCLEEALAEEIVEDFEWWLSCVEADCFYKHGTEGWFMVLLRSFYNQNTE